MGNQIDALARDANPLNSREHRAEIARAVKRATAALNNALFDAADIGLVVQVEFLTTEQVGGPPSYVVRSRVMEEL